MNNTRIERWTFGGQRPDRDNEFGEHVTYEDHVREMEVGHDMLEMRRVEVHTLRQQIEQLQAELATAQAALAEANYELDKRAVMIRSLVDAVRERS
jgi:multidrug resistance efflux pump